MYGGVGLVTYGSTPQFMEGISMTADKIVIPDTWPTECSTCDKVYCDDDKQCQCHVYTNPERVRGNKAMSPNGKCRSYKASISIK